MNARSLSVSDIKERLKRNNPTIQYVGEFTKTKAPAKFKCTVCKTVWTTRCSHVLQGDRGCPKCAIQKRAKTLSMSKQEFIKRLRLVSSDIKLIGNWTNTRSKTEFKHVCGHNWTARPSSILMDKTTCPKCSYATRVIGRQLFYTVSLGKRKSTVCGFEPQALNWIKSNTRIQAKQITVQTEKQIPIFYYKHKGKNCRYFPDFLIKSKNIIVEVKSTSTLGLVPNLYRLDQFDMFERLKKKRVAVIGAGFKFNLLVMNKDGTRVKLPQNWYDLTLRQVKRFIR